MRVIVIGATGHVGGGLVHLGSAPRCTSLGTRRREAVARLTQHRHSPIPPIPA